MSKKGFDSARLMIFVIWVIGIGFLVGNITQWVTSVENKTIEGEVVDYELFDDYILLTFDNGEKIKVALKSPGTSRVGDNDLDFTVHSRMIVKFEKYSWWLMPNDDRWDVLQIIKVPDGGD